MIAKGGSIPARAAEPAHQRIGADAHELVHHAIAGDKNILADLDMAASNAPFAKISCCPTGNCGPRGRRP